MTGSESVAARRRAVTLVLALLFAVALPGAALAAPPEPVYQHGVGDCVTGDNQFWSQSDQKFHWWVNQAPGSDGSSGPIKCDSYQNDQYERPTDQTFQQRTISEKPLYLPPPFPASPVYLSGMAADPEFPVGADVFAASGKYFEYGDITRGRAGSLDAGTDGWLFFQVELFGDSTVSDSLSRSSEFASSMYYSVRLGANADPNKANGGILLRNQRQANITTAWSTSDAKVFADTNGDVSGAGGVTTVAEGGNGYETDQGNQAQWLWVRRTSVPFVGPGGAVMRPAVEFAFNYKLYNQQKGKAFTPAALSYVDLDATKGLQDNQNYLWNDEYSLSQAGSPNPGEIAGGTGTKNIYQLDTLRLGGFPPPPAQLTVVKQTAPQSSGADQFDFTLTDKAGFTLDTDGDDSDGATASRSFAFTTFGAKTVRESQLPAGWDLTDIACAGAPAQYGSDSATVTLQPGTDATCTFTNTKRAKVEIVKQTAPAGFDEDFAFTGGLGPFSLNAETTPSTGIKLVRPGDYTVSETVPAGWDLTDVTCTGDADSSGASGAALLALAAGDDVRCVFTNTKRASVTVEKTEGGSSQLGRDWQFELSGNGIAPVTRSTAGGNPIEFGDLRAGTYTLCEIGIPLAWHSSLEAPPHNGVRSDDGQTAKVCIAVTLGIGEREHVAVDNVRPDVELSKEVRRLPGGTFAKTAPAHVGDTVEYRFRVTNPGVGELTVVLAELAPDRCDAGTSTAPAGDADTDGRLDPGEQWDYFCTHAITAQDADPLPNTAKATGTDEYGNTDDDESSASVDVLHPDIEIDKQADRAAAHVGDTIQYRFDVTNDGDTPLTVAFSDPRCDAGSLTGPAGDADGDQRLDVDETWVYRCAHVVTAQDPDPLPNTAKVTGTDELDGRDEDEDSTSVEILKPGALVIKEGNAFAYPGDTVTFTFAVTNNGDAPLSEVTVTDDRCAPVTRSSGDELLDPGETWIFTCSKQIPPGHRIGDENPIRNVATVTGKDPLGQTVTDDDDHLVRVLHPAVDIEKSGPATAVLGTALAYMLTVTNTGDVPFASQQVVVTDPRCEAPPAGPNTGGDATPVQLDPGEAWTYTCTAQTTGQPAGTFVNTATVTAKDFNDRPVTDSDDFPTVLEAPQPPQVQPPPESQQQQQVLPQLAIVNGAARLRGPSGCVRKPFTATVRGTRIAAVTFYRDGKRIKRIVAERGQRIFSVKVTPGAGTPRVHRVTARVRFRAASRTRMRTLRLSYQRCRKQVVLPRFTG